MRTRTDIEAEISENRDYLSALKARKLSIVSGGATEWETRDGDMSRRVKNLSLEDIRAEITVTESKIRELLAELDGFAGLAFSVSPMFSQG